MDKRSFVDSVQSFVGDTAVEDTYENAIDPPGKAPTEIEQSIAKWVNNLLAKEKEYVQYLIKSAVDEALFGIFCVIDGVRSITEEDGSFILQFKSNEATTTLNDDKDEYLHDILNKI